jgi:malate/lactate dehydrogenase/CheY-like chemotaxis protein
MKRPKIVIIDDDTAIRNVLRESIKNPVKKETGIEFDVKEYSQCPENIDEITDANIYFIDFFLPGKKGDEIARELKEKGAQGERIMITGNLPEAIEQMSRLGKKSIFTAYSKDRADMLAAWYEVGGQELFPRLLSKPFETKKLIDIISDLRNKRRIQVPLSLGVIGLGRLGRETIERASDVSWINRIEVYSEFFNQNESKAYELYPKVIGAVATHKRLEGILESNPDVLFIATGTRSKITKREKMFAESAEKIFPVFKAVGRMEYLNPIINGSNPIEALVKLGHELGISPRQLIGQNVTDTLRTRRMLIEGPYLPERVDAYDIHLDVLGTHSQPLPIFSTATVRGKPLGDLTDYKKFREEFVKELTEIGKKIMIGAQTIGSYSDAPNAVMEMLEDLSNLAKRPRSCWSMYNNQTGFYVTSTPVDITYNGRPKIIPGKSPELDSWEKHELDNQNNQFNSQRSLVRKFLKSK